MDGHIGKKSVGWVEETVRAYEGHIRKIHMEQRQARQSVLDVIGPLSDLLYGKWYAFNGDKRLHEEIAHADRWGATTTSIQRCVDLLKLAECIRDFSWYADKMGLSMRLVNGGKKGQLLEITGEQEAHGNWDEKRVVVPVAILTMTREEIDALYEKTPWGKRPHEGKAVKCRDGWILQPHGADFAWAVRNDGRVVVPPTVGPAPTHYHEFVDCCLAGRSAATDFSWSTYMRECVIAGEIAERVVGTKITWDAKARRFDSAAANAFLTRPYRKGWEIPGLTAGA